MTIFSFSNSKGSRENQDCIDYFCQSNHVVLCVADGMGGSKGGALASKTVVDHVMQGLRESVTSSVPDLIQEARGKLVEIAKADSSLEDMGTTITACLIKDSKANFFHVGDSRIYQLRKHGLVSKTKDQSELQYLIDTNVIKKNQAKNYPRRNILLSVVSPKIEYELQTGSFHLEERDRLILISDGVYNVLRKKEILDESVRNPDLTNFIKGLERLIVKRGEVDDFSCIGYQHDSL